MEFTLRIYGIKNSSLATATDVQAPVLTSETTSSTATDTTISQNDTEVNSSIREKGGNNTKFSLPEIREINNIDDLMSEIEENSVYTYGLRSINEHDAEMMSRGYLDVSYRWIDNEITDEKLNGSSAVYVDDYMSKDELLKRYKAVIKTYPKNGVDTILLIRDKHFEWGEDENEVVLGHNGYGADVVAVVKLDDIEEKGNTKLSIPEQTSAEYELLSHENEDLRKQVEALKSEMKLTKGHKVKPEAVKKLTNKILREYSSKADKEEISARLEHIFKICRRRKRAGFLHNNFYLKTKIECS